MSFLVGFWQFLEQVWGALMSFLVGFWEFLELVKRASMSFQEGFWKLLGDNHEALMSLQLTTGTIVRVKRLENNLKSVLSVLKSVYG